jgi:CubicO group peptidase (beta-lactamase class C family)
VSRQDDLPDLVNGTTAPGFESVRSLFAQQMRTLAEENAQLCVYHRGEKVVDLWASKTGDTAFGPDSLINIFSSGKSLEAIAVASLVGRGLLRYDAKVADYWPEFRGSGKDDVRVADVMRHEAGLANFDTPLDVDDLLPENIKANRVGAIIEQQPQRFRSIDSGRREYHAMTRGWIVNELFRRVDPAGRTIGEYLRDELSIPLAADVAVGLDENQLQRVSKVTLLGFGTHILESLKPRWLGRRVLHNFLQLMARIIRVMLALRKGSSSAAAATPIQGMSDMDFFNEPRMRRSETSPANAHASARGLARVAAMMAAGGRLDNVECLPGEAWTALHQDPLPDRMGGVLPTRFTQGGVDQFLLSSRGSPLLERAFNDGREGFFGWMGLGGSIFQWHPEAEIGFAFVPTSLHMLDFLNERGKLYQAEVLRCVAALEPAHQRFTGFSSGNMRH